MSYTAINNTQRVFDPSEESFKVNRILCIAQKEKKV